MSVFGYNRQPRNAKVDSTFKCPVCRRLHAVGNADSLADYELHCTDNVTSELKLIRGQENEDKFTVNNWNFNEFDVEKKSYTNNAPLINISLNKPHPKNINNGR